MISADIKERNFAVVIRSLQTLDTRVLQACARGLRSGLDHTVDVIRREELSGPRPEKLDVRTTRLRGSIASEVTLNEKGVTGRVGTNIAYGALHEFGFVGTMNVRAHTRFFSAFNAAGQRVKVTRRTIRDREGNVIGFKESTLGAAQREAHPFVFTVEVKAHTRKVNYKGRPFVRPALEKSVPVIQQEIEKELGTIT
jgi:phage gpG-like protein